MKAVLLIDFGSTYTKVTAVDVEAEIILGTAQSFTTIETDINDGLQSALGKLEEFTMRSIPNLVAKHKQNHFFELCSRYP